MHEFVVIGLIAAAVVLAWLRGFTGLLKSEKTDPLDDNKKVVEDLNALVAAYRGYLDRHEKTATAMEAYILGDGEKPEVDPEAFERIGKAKRGLQNAAFQLQRFLENPYSNFNREQALRAIEEGWSDKVWLYT